MFKKIFFIFLSFLINGYARLLDDSKQVLEVSDSKHIQSILSDISEEISLFIHLESLVSSSQEAESRAQEIFDTKNSKHKNSLLLYMETDSSKLIIKRSPDLYEKISEFEINQITSRELQPFMNERQYSKVITLFINFIIKKFDLAVENTLMLTNFPIRIKNNLSNLRKSLLPIFFLFLLIYPWYRKLTKKNKLMRGLYGASFSLIAAYIVVGSHWYLIFFVSIVCFFIAGLGYNFFFSFVTSGDRILFQDFAKNKYRDDTLPGFNGRYYLIDINHELQKLTGQQQESFKKRLDEFTKKTGYQLIVSQSLTSNPYPAASLRFGLLLGFIVTMLICFYVEFPEAYLSLVLAAALVIIFSWIGKNKLIKKYNLLHSEMIRVVKNRAFHIYFANLEDGYLHQSALLYYSKLENKISVILGKNIAQVLTSDDIEQLLSSLRSEQKDSKDFTLFIEPFIDKLQCKILEYIPTNSLKDSGNSVSKLVII